MIDQPDPHASKDEWRVWAKTVRSAIDFPKLSSAVVHHLARWEQLRSAETVLLYLPMADEVDTTGLMGRGLAVRFTATRTPDVAGVLSVHELGGPLQVHRLGFLQPHSSAPRVDPKELDVLLIPALVFDKTGVRIGRGRGYFDELLERVRPDALRVGIAPSSLIVDALPHDEEDEPVGWLATEIGVTCVE